MGQRFLFAVAFGLVAGPTWAGTDADDLKQLQGTWVVVAAERGGKKAEGPDYEKFAAGFRLVIEGDMFRAVGPGSDDSAGTVRVDTSGTPKEITFTRKDGKQTRGVYELRDGTLRLCSGSAGDPRPKEFKTAPGDTAILLTLKKQAK